MSWPDPFYDPFYDDGIREVIIEKETITEKKLPIIKRSKEKIA